MASSALTAFVTPSHLDAFSTSGYKRSFNSIGAVAANEFKRASTLPAPSVRNDRGTNVTMPVARSCSQPVFPGEVAFTRTGKGFPSFGNGTSFLPTITLDQINDELSMAPLTLTSRIPENLLKRDQSSTTIFTKRRKRMQPLKFSSFEVDHLTDDLNHPLHAYALDGVVCSASDSREGGALKHYGGKIVHQNGDYAEPMGCNVAVFGQSPLCAATLKKQAVRMGCAIYVVLIASRQDRTSAVWTFRYELLTSAELDLDPSLRRFKVNKMRNLAALRVPVKMWQLGAVTDTNSGYQGLPLHFTISVKMKPFNGSVFRKIKLLDDTEILIKVPPDKYGPEELIFPRTKEQLRIDKQLYMNNAARHKREIVGYRRRPAAFGGFATAAAPTQAEFDALKTAFSAQRQLQQELRDALFKLIIKLNAAKVKVDQDVKDIQTEVAEAAADIIALGEDTEEVKTSVAELKEDTTATKEELKEKLERVENAVKEIESSIYQ